MEELLAWARRIQVRDRESAYIFFKHEVDGAGQEMAARFLDLAQP